MMLTRRPPFRLAALAAALYAIFAVATAAAKANADSSNSNSDYDYDYDYDYDDDSNDSEDYDYDDDNGGLNSAIDPFHLIDFLADGHVLLSDVLPELRDAEVRDEHERARIEAGKDYERHFVEIMKCDEVKAEAVDDDGRDLMAMIEDGDGMEAMRMCMESLVPDYITDERERDDYMVERKPFYQLVNVHEYGPKLRDLALGARLGSIASDLLRVDRVRLYQTRTFRKVPTKDDGNDGDGDGGGGSSTMRNLFNHPTYMHADLGMVPLDTNGYVTFWCPLRDLTDEDSVLTYATGSHRDAALWNWYGGNDDDEDEEEEEEKEEDEEEEEEEGGELIREGKKNDDDEKEEEESDESRRISDEDRRVNDVFDGRYPVTWYSDLTVGDCVVHHGWLQHGSTSQAYRNGNGPREALAFSYIDGDARKLRSGRERNGADDFMDGRKRMDDIMFRDWYYDVMEGEPIADHPKLPLVWPPRPPPPPSPSTEDESRSCETCDPPKEEEG
eukprot:CAMPEP_0113588974 /NCGR_PEP_ID=MMETSP0015_2-20120614/35827_1 /TAXON_ID=2838 /ORGANISM="Odontella" /LENGTH=500 /DNA_ID=CAMNT_0000494935 /DNA_START=422 /DNA_END=1924 /DNA_ORIENTATION=+ /assembly_acc=CAM_ASM_000160